MKLHYSQTVLSCVNTAARFQYLMKLHYSQTEYVMWFLRVMVSVPYEITLLSNHNKAYGRNDRVSVPYEITLLSNLK